MKNKLLATGVLSAIALTSVIGVGTSAFADSSDSSQGNKAPTAEQIAQHQARHAERLEERLTELVEQGEITETQKQEILDFFEENKPNLDADATREEREAAREEFAEAFEEFAQENGIDSELIKPKKGPKGNLSVEERLERQEEHLSELVEQGTITEDQKDAIIQFREENKPETDPGELTQEERQAQREQMRDAFEEFAQENGIDPELIKPSKGPGGHRGLR